MLWRCLGYFEIRDHVSLSVKSTSEVTYWFEFLWKVVGEGNVWIEVNSCSALRIFCTIDELPCVVNVDIISLDDSEYQEEEDGKEPKEERHFLLFFFLFFFVFVLLFNFLKCVYLFICKSKNYFKILKASLWPFHSWIMMSLFFVYLEKKNFPCHT